MPAWPCFCPPTAHLLADELTSQPPCRAAVNQFIVTATPVGPGNGKLTAIGPGIQLPGGQVRGGCACPRSVHTCHGRRRQQAAGPTLPALGAHALQVEMVFDASSHPTAGKQYQLQAFAHNSVGWSPGSGVVDYTAPPAVRGEEGRVTMHGVEVRRVLCRSRPVATPLNRLPAPLPQCTANAVCGDATQAACMCLAPWTCSDVDNKCTVRGRPARAQGGVGAVQLGCAHARSSLPSCSRLTTPTPPCAAVPPQHRLLQAVQPL